MKTKNFRSIELEITTNEFIDKKDWFGFNDNEPEPYTFMQIENSFTSKAEESNMKDNIRSLNTLKIRLSEKKRTYNRNQYDIMTLLSDFGGFQDVVVIIPSLFLSVYSSRMFQINLLTEIPAKEDKKNDSKDKI